MLNITEATNLQQLYDCQLRFPSPYFFPQAFDVWEKSFTEDVDGQGRRLFKELSVKAAYDQGELLGFIQYGKSAFGFDSQGDLSSEVSCQIIRNLYFCPGRPDAGEKLLEAALDSFDLSQRVYGFFHYFGMSCFARHGKLFERHAHIETLLKQKGFVVEHENVYYSSVLTGQETGDAELVPQNLTAGRQQYMDFRISGQQVGGCEVHFVDETTAYLRWIYVNGDITGKGVGSRCMGALKHWLRQKGITRLDTDTALTNPVAQHFYEKNGFTREGITRSYYL